MQGKTGGQVAQLVEQRIENKPVSWLVSVKANVAQFATLSELELAAGTTTRSLLLRACCGGG
jgi:hypothetical protein